MDKNKKWQPCSFDRDEYLDGAENFESVSIADPEPECCEFSDDLESIAIELAYTRYQVAKLEQFIKNGVEFGYITVPDKPDPARQTIDAILGKDTK